MRSVPQAELRAAPGSRLEPSSEPKHPALLLPALSSISTAHEMDRLAAKLADRLTCTVLDWPGFGDGPIVDAPLTADTMRAFLDSRLSRVGEAPTVGIAAGHGATYLVEAARRHRGRFARLVLIAPTWRGPLPTMLKGRLPNLPHRVRTALERPGLGPLLYRLNVSRPVVRRMLRAHVYADPAHVTEEVLSAKIALTRRSRRRFATAAFVTGGLDPVRSRAMFLALFAGDLPPVLMIRPEQAPPRSAAEMDALTETGRVTTARVPGALAAHEEHDDAVASAIGAFLADMTPIASG